MVTATFDKTFIVSDSVAKQRLYEIMEGKIYMTFPKWNALRSELSWTHYRSLMRVADEVARNFYLEEAAKSGWSSRQLDRQINSFYYQRILASRDKAAVAVRSILWKLNRSTKKL